MSDKRVKRLNSLLKEVLNEVVRSEVRNPKMCTLTSITEVDITKDLRQAKVYISVIGTEQEKNTTLEVLQSAAGFISVLASKKVVMRYFPSLTFKLDTTVETQMRINSLLEKIHVEQEKQSDD